MRYSPFTAIGRALLFLALLAPPTVPSARAASPPSAASGSEAQWTSGGPDGGSITSIAVAGAGVLYATASPGGLFRSADEGRTWSAVQSDLLSSSDVLVAAADAFGHVYVGNRYAGDSSPCKGIAVSRDGGSTWVCHTLNTPFQIWTLIIAADGSVVAGPSGGGPLLRSTDHGATWTESAPLNGSVRGLASGPDGVLYAASRVLSGYSAPSGTVYASSDWGSHWREAASGLPGRAVAAVAVDRNGVVYAGTEGGGVYRSGDLGVTWRAASGGLPKVGLPYVLSAPQQDWLHVSQLVGSEDGTMRAGTSEGVFVSVDGGASWVPDGNGLASLDITALAAAPSGSWFAGTGGAGVFTRAGGALWTAANAGLGAAIVYHVEAAGPLVAYAAGYALHKTSDGGLSWRTVHSGFKRDQVVAFAAGSSGLFAAWDVAGLHKSVDDGQTWSHLTAPGGYAIRALALDPAGHLYAVGRLAPGGISETRLLRSADGGSTWSISPAPPWQSPYYDASLYALGGGQLAVMLVGMYGGRALQHSDNDGDTWTPAAPSVSYVQVRGVAANVGGRMFAWASEPSSGGSIDTLFRSDDGGGHWTATGPSLPSDYSTASVAASGNAVYLGRYQEVLATRIDVAPRWTRIGFPPFVPSGMLSITDLAVAPGTSGLLYAATSGRGVFTTRVLERDDDADGLPDQWERDSGLDPDRAEGDDGPDGDPDHDGTSNLQEYVRGTHPRGTHAQYFAEGAVGVFDTRFSMLNVGVTDSHVLLTYELDDGKRVSQAVTVPSGGSESVVAREGLLQGGRTTAAFSTIVESDAPVIVDRYQWWTVDYSRGSHLETAQTAPASTWYLAEGATHSGFRLYYLLHNPGAATATAEITYLLPAPREPLVKSYELPQHSRVTIAVNDETFPLEAAALSSTDVSAIVRVTAGPPIVVERAMYLGTFWNPTSMTVGHASAGVTAPALEWYFAEGATGNYFDAFLLIANVDLTPADVQVTFHLPDGTTVQRRVPVEPLSRFTMYVEGEDGRLADTAFGMKVESMNGVPVIAERAMYWSGMFPFWQEGHVSHGATAPAARWAFAAGDATTGNETYETYVLVVNPTDDAAYVRVSLVPEGSTTPVAREYLVAATSRMNVYVAGEFPELVGHRFGGIVESLAVPGGSSPVPIVVERSIYGPYRSYWEFGANSLATVLP